MPTRGSRRFPGPSPKRARARRVRKIATETPPVQAPRRRVALVVALAATALAFWLPFALRTTWAVGLPLVVPAWLWFGSTSGSALRVVFRDEDPSALLAAAATVITGLAAGMMLSVLSPVGEDGYFIFDLVGIWTLPLTVPYFIGAVTNRGQVRKTILFVAIVSSLVWGALAAVLVDAGAGAEASSGRVLAGILTMSLSPLAILALFALRVPHIGHRGNVGPRHGTAATLVILLLSASLPASGTHIARAEGETQLLHSSYVGGEYDDLSQAIAVDGQGNFWVRLRS